MKQKTITIAIWILNAVVAITFVITIFFATSALIYPHGDSSGTINGMSLIPSVAISSGVFIAILTFARGRQKVEIKHQ